MTLEPLAQPVEQEEETHGYMYVVTYADYMHVRTIKELGKELEHQHYSGEYSTGVYALELGKNDHNLTPVELATSLAYTDAEDYVHCQTKIILAGAEIGEFYHTIDGRV